MIRVNYRKYLENQKEWAESLTRMANIDSGVTDREAALLAILAVDRLIAISLRPSLVIDGRRRQDLPGGHDGPEILAA